VADVVALVDAAGAERVHLVGHDWGGGVAWMFAATRPDRLHRYRAMPLDASVGLRAGAVTVPTTYVWSTDDIAIGRRAAVHPGADQQHFADDLKTSGGRMGGDGSWRVLNWGHAVASSGTGGDPCR
jgi:dienelactone hydrolase